MTVKNAIDDLFRTESLVKYLNKKVEDSDAKETIKIDLPTSEIIEISKLAEHYHSLLEKLLEKIEI